MDKLTREFNKLSNTDDVQIATARRELSPTDQKHFDGYLHDQKEDKKNWQALLEESRNQRIAQTANKSALNLTHDRGAAKQRTVVQVADVERHIQTYPDLARTTNSRPPTEQDQRILAARVTVDNWERDQAVAYDQQQTKEALNLARELLAGTHNHPNTPDPGRTR